MIRAFLLCQMFCLPLRHLSLTSAYGYRIHPITGQYRFHQGVDLRARHDTVFAVTAGIATIGYDSLLGIFLRISDGKLICTYGHLSTVLIDSAQVTEGMPIAITGSTGRVTGEHLHLAISYDGKAVDPLRLLYQFIHKSNNHE